LFLADFRRGRDYAAAGIVGYNFRKVETGCLFFGKEDGARAEVMILALKTKTGIRLFQIINLRKVNLVTGHFSIPAILVIRECALCENRKQQ